MNGNRVRTSAFLAGFLAFLAAFVPCRAADQIPAERQALLLMKTLSFDRKLGDRSGASVVVAVLSPDGKSGGDCDAVKSAIDEVAQQMKVGGLAAQTVELSFGDGSQLDKKLKGAKAAAMYVCEGLEKESVVLTTAARRAGVLSFTASSSLVDKGLSVGLILRADKAVIRVNVKAAREEGADLDPQLLRLAEIVE